MSISEVNTKAEIIPAHYRNVPPWMHPDRLIDLRRNPRGSSQQRKLCVPNHPIDIPKACFVEHRLQILGQIRVDLLTRPFQRIATPRRYPRVPRAPMP